MRCDADYKLGGLKKGWTNSWKLRGTMSIKLDGKVIASEGHQLDFSRLQVGWVL